jgi:hypothetical protein
VALPDFEMVIGGIVNLSWVESGQGVKSSEFRPLDQLKHQK